MSHIYFLPHAVERADSLYGGCDITMENHEDIANMIVDTCFTPLNILNGTHALDVSRATLPSNQLYSTSLLFMCCGTAGNEIKVLEYMHQQGVQLNRVLFFDKWISSDTLHKLQQYYDKHEDYVSRVHIECTFDLLTQFMRETQEEYTKDGGTSVRHRWVVVGMNAIFRHVCSDNLYSCYRFLIQCARFAALDQIHPQWINILQNPYHGASPETPILTTREGQPIEMIRVFSKPWWEFAVETISDEDAKRILVGK